MKQLKISNSKKTRFKRLLQILSSSIFPILLVLAYFERMLLLWLIVMLVGVLIFIGLMIEANKGKLSASKREKYYEVHGPEAKKMGYFLSVIFLIVLICLLAMSHLRYGLL